VTIGTAGAQHMTLSSIEDFSSEAIDGRFGILDIALENDQKILTGTLLKMERKKRLWTNLK
jgi:hypothetical protein